MNLTIYVVWSSVWVGQGPSINTFCYYQSLNYFLLFLFEGQKRKWFICYFFGQRQHETRVSPVTHIKRLLSLGVALYSLISLPKLQTEEVRRRRCYQRFPWRRPLPLLHVSSPRRRLTSRWCWPLRSISEPKTAISRWRDTSSNAATTVSYRALIPFLFNFC